MNPNDPKFADSAKNGVPFFENEALNNATRKLFEILNEERPKEGPVKAPLARLLREIQTRQMFAGERDENGRQVFKTFEHFVKYVRRLYVGLPGGHKGDRYKHVTEALTYNRLEDAKCTILPVQRSVLQKLCTVEPEIQIDAWDKTVKDTGGKGITPADVAKAAIALGDVKVSLPAPTASSKMPLVRQRWDRFKFDVVAKFGDSIREFFPPLDEVIVSKGEKSANQVSAVPEAKPAPEKPAPEAKPEEPAQSAPIGADADELTARQPVESGLGTVKIWSEGDAHVLRFNSPKHKEEVTSKVSIWHMGYRRSDGSYNWRRKPQPPQTLADIRSELIKAFNDAGIAYLELQSLEQE